MDEQQYFELVSELRRALPPSDPFWKLERFWTVTDERPVIGKEAE